MRSRQLFILLLLLEFTFINASLAVEEVEYNITVPDYIDVEKNITISNILSYRDVTDVYDSAPWSLDWGDKRSPYKWNVTTANGNVPIGFERYETVSTNPLSITFFRTVTENLGSHVETRYREEDQSSPAGMMNNSTPSGEQATTQKEKTSGFEITLVIAAILALHIYQRKRN